MTKSQDILATLRSLKAQLKEIGQLDEDTRRQAYHEANAITVALESDGDTLVRHGWGVLEPVALDVGLRTGLLQHLVDATKPVTAQELAKTSGADELLTERLLRCLAAWKAIDSHPTTDGETYSANRVTALTVSPRGRYHMQWMFETIAPGAVDMPRKIEETGFKCLTSDTNTPYNDLRNRHDVPMFQLLSPKEVQAFKGFMPTFNLEGRDWLDVYPAAERLIAGASTDPNSVMLVDVGGNVGHQAAVLRDMFPDAPGRYVVQDKAAVIANTLPGLEGMAHDFFDPQPVKGARAYYFRYIMHSWADEYNVKILSHIRDAMTPGYSRLLIHDWVMPEGNASPLMSSMDLLMMAIAGGSERTLARHKPYIEAAGLEVTGVWDLKDGRSNAIIECGRPQ